MSISLPFQVREGDWRGAAFFGKQNLLSLRSQNDLPRFTDILQTLGGAKHWIDPWTCDQTMSQPELIPVWNGIRCHAGELQSTVPIYCGESGIGWFSAALASIATSQLAQACVVAIEETCGIYEIRLWKWSESKNRVEPLYVCVDRRIAIKNHQKKPFGCFAGIPGILWPSLIEKAFVKALLSRNGKTGYMNLMSEPIPIPIILSHLLGPSNYFPRIFKPITPSSNFPADKLTLDILERLQKGHHLTISFQPDANCSSLSTSKNSPMKGYNGLVAEVEYVVVCAAVVNNHTILVLHPPWSGDVPEDPSCQWNGDWSEHSSLWKMFPGKWEQINPVPPCFCIDMMDVAIHAVRVATFIPHWGQLLQADWEDDIFRRCNRCGHPIDGSIMQVLGKKYHISCMTCVVCDKPFPNKIVATAPNNLPAHSECLNEAKIENYKWSHCTMTTANPPPIVSGHQQYSPKRLIIDHPMKDTEDISKSKSCIIS